MKKLFIYILLFLYTAVQLKPLAAVVQDMVAHTFFAAKHMATVHFENGTYHVHKELKTIDEETKNLPRKAASSERTIESASPQSVPDLQFIFTPHETMFQHGLLSNPGLSAGFVSDTFHPPLVA